MVVEKTQREKNTSKHFRIKSTLEENNKNSENSKSSIVVEVIRTVLFFYERYFNYKSHKQNHLTNIPPNIYKKSHPNCPYKPLNFY